MRVIIRLFSVVLSRVLRIQGFSSEALAQCQSAADVEHILEELENLHQVQYACSCNTWVSRLRQLSGLFVQDLADDVGIKCLGSGYVSRSSIEFLGG